MRISHCLFALCINLRPLLAKFLNVIFKTFWQNLLLLRLLQSSAGILIKSPMETMKNVEDTDLINSFGFNILNNNLTRVSSSADICIDHVISNENPKTSTSECSISEHFALTVDLKLPILTIRKKQNFTCRNFKHFNIGDNQLKYLLLLYQLLAKIDQLIPIDELIQKFVDSVLER